MSERLVDKVLSASIEERNAIYLSLTPEEKNALAVILDAETNNPWARYEHVPRALTDHQRSPKLENNVEYHDEMKVEVKANEKFLNSCRNLA